MLTEWENLTVLACTADSRALIVVVQWRMTTKQDGRFVYPLCTYMITLRYSLEAIICSRKNYNWYMHLLPVEFESPWTMYKLAFRVFALTLFEPAALTGNWQCIVQSCLIPQAQLEIKCWKFSRFPFRCQTAILIMLHNMLCGGVGSLVCLWYVMKYDLC